MIEFSFQTCDEILRICNIGNAFVIFGLIAFQIGGVQVQLASLVAKLYFVIQIKIIIQIMKIHEVLSSVVMRLPNIVVIEEFNGIEKVALRILILAIPSVGRKSHGLLVGNIVINIQITT